MRNIFLENFQSTVKKERHKKATGKKLEKQRIFLDM